MDFQGRHVVVTGRTGALGEAVVGTLLAAGASCHVPYRREQEAIRFAHRNHNQLSLVPLGDLTDERSVTAFYEDLSTLWASIHIAGGFAAAPMAQSDKALLMGQLDSNLISACLCSRAAVAAFRRGPGPGCIVNVAARQALEPRLGAAVAPSIMDTPANRRSMPQADFDAWPKVDEVAATIAFLASPQNAVTRGALMPVYGKV
jgi:NAD(P)-dependent dehydrogenase (short-subunit alcohol dehydrogenase family)